MNGGAGGRQPYTHVHMHLIPRPVELLAWYAGVQTQTVLIPLVFGVAT